MNSTLIDDESIKEIMDKSKARITEKVEETVVNAVIDKMNWTMSDAIDELVKEFVETEIVPEIETVLAANKDQIVDGLSVATIDICGAMFDKMVENATKNLTGYRGDEIFKKLFT